MTAERGGRGRPKEPPDPRTLAEKLDHLFTIVRPARGEYSHEQVAAAIAASEGSTISAAYLWQLRKGLRDNPTMKHLEALAEFFGVSPAYFFDDEATARIDADLALLAALRDDAVRQLALRAAGLSAESVAALTALTERLRQLEDL